MKPWQSGLQQRKMKAKTDRYSDLMDLLIRVIFLFAALIRADIPRRTSDSQELEGVARAGLKERGHLLSTFTFIFSHLADTFIQSDLQLGNT